MPIAIAIDPEIIAIPTAPGPEEATRFITRLQEWAAGERDWAPRLLISNSASKALAEANRYPVYSTLQSTLGHLRLDFVDIQTLAMMTSRLAACNSLEEAANIDDVCFEKASGCLGVCVSETEPLLHCKFRSVLILGMWSRRHQATQVFFAAFHDAVAQGPHDFSFTKVLLEENNTISELGDVDLRLGIVRGWDDVSASVNEANLFANGQFDDVVAAIHIAASQMICVGASNKRFGFTVSPHFVEDLIGLHISHHPQLARRVVRSCAEAVTGLHPEKSHTLRESEGGSSSQLRRGNLAAWRRDVDVEYHIQYWIGPLGQIQFSSIGVHNIITIHEP